MPTIDADLYWSSNLRHQRLRELLDTKLSIKAHTMLPNSGQRHVREWIGCNLWVLFKAVEALETWDEYDMVIALVFLKHYYQEVIGAQLFGLSRKAYRSRLWSGIDAFASWNQVSSLYYITVFDLMTIC